MREYRLCQVTIDDVAYFSAYIVIGEDWNGFAKPFFTLDEGKKICEFLNSGMKKWVVMNLTDEIQASVPMSRIIAEKFMAEFPLRFIEQGYYLTSNGHRIAPHNIRLEIRPAFESTDVHNSIYDEDRDRFLFWEQVDEYGFGVVEYFGEDITLNGQEFHVYPIGTGRWAWCV